MTTAQNARNPHFLAALALGLVVTWLAGCSFLGSSEIHPGRYTLKPGAVPQPAETGSQARFPATLAVPSVKAPAWLSSKRMLYRLDYRDDQKLAAYTRSAWADTPAGLIAGNLEQALSARHLFNAVIGDEQGQAALALQIKLADFSQHFSSPQTSQGRIEVTATLLQPDSGDVIAQRSFVETAPAPQGDADGGVQALTQADQQLNTAIAQWLADTVAACGKKCLR
jgi:cholesterol transport system auxiliary component